MNPITSPRSIQRCIFVVAHKKAHRILTCYTKVDIRTLGTYAMNYQNWVTIISYTLELSFKLTEPLRDTKNVNLLVLQKYETHKNYIKTHNIDKNACQNHK